MASIAKDPNGRKRLTWIDHKGDRQTVHLGKMNLPDAREVKTKVENIQSAMISGRAYDNATAEWIAEIPDSLAEKFVTKGLIEPPEPRDTTLKSTLEPFLADYLQRRIDVKAATKEIYGHCIRNLTDHFGGNCELSTINAGNAEDFKMHLISLGLAKPTIHKRLQNARMFFHSAVKQKLIAENPFADIKHAPTMDPGRQYFVTHQEISQLLAVCDPTWRTIVSLSRFGGLRCPSEVLSLRWQDINFDTERILVLSPKTEHLPGKASRVMPMFPELKTILSEAFDLAPEGAEYVVGGNYREVSNTAKGWRNINMRTPLIRLIERAGLTPWPRLFHNLRASRQTELTRKYPVHVVAAWLGNTPKTAEKHYLQVTDADFQQATESGTESGTQNHDMAQKAAQHTHAYARTDSPEATQPLDGLGGYANRCDSRPGGANPQSGRGGIRTFVKNLGEYGYRPTRQRKMQRTF